MDAVEYLKEKTRLCNEFKHCRDCILGKIKDGTCGEEKCPEQTVEIVEKWSKENPVKTYLSVLLEKFPKTPLDSYGIPRCFCPEAIFGGDEWEHCNGIIDNKCTKCWNREYKEEE